jgi:hypothetical protein
MKRVAYKKKHWGKTTHYPSVSEPPIYPESISSKKKKKEKEPTKPMTVTEYHPASTYKVEPKFYPERSSRERKCANCGDPVGQYGTTIHGEPYCEDCYSDMFFVCDKCGEIKDNEEFNYYNDEGWCDECYNDLPSCQSCGEKLDSDQLYYVEGFGDYCEDCFAEKFSSCEGCEDTYPLEELRKIRPLGKDYPEYLCPDCYNEAVKELREAKRQERYERAHEDKTCSRCGKKAPIIDENDRPTNLMFKIDDEYLCNKCMQEAEGQETLFSSRWSKTAKLAKLYLRFSSTLM